MPSARRRKSALSCIGCALKYQRNRAGLAPELAQEQLEAPLIVEAGKVQKPPFPASDLERTGIVFAALMLANRPLDPSGRRHVVERRTREFCVSNIFKRPRLPRATCS